MSITYHYGRFLPRVARLAEAFYRDIEQQFARRDQLQLQLSQLEAEIAAAETDFTALIEGQYNATEITEAQALCQQRNDETIRKPEPPAEEV